MESEDELAAVCAEQVPRFVFNSLTGDEVELIPGGRNICVRYEIELINGRRNLFT